MKKTAIFSLLFLSLIRVNGFCQNNTFVREYNSVGENFVDVTGSGYLLAGSVSNNPGVVLTKTDWSGNVLWSKKFIDNNSGTLASIKRISGGRYIVLMSSSSQLILFGVDSSANIIWSAKYSSPSLGLNQSLDKVNSIERLNNGDLVIVGYGSTKLGYMRTDSMGNLLSSGCLKFSQPFFFFLDPIIVRELSNQDLVFAATVVDQNSMGYGWITRTNASISSIKNQFFYGSITPYAMKAEGNNLIMTMRGTPCQSCTSEVVMRIDTLGNGFGRTYSESSGWWTSIIQTKDHGYAFSGGSRSFSVQGGGVLVKTDSMFNVQWAERLGKTGFLDMGEIVRGLSQTQDKGFVINGRRLIKTDSLGSGTCLDSAVIYTQTGFGPTNPNTPPFPIVLDTLNISTLVSNLVGSNNMVADSLYCFTGIHEEISNSEITIYPNPSSDIIHIRFEGSSNEKRSAVLYDMFGRQVLTQALTSAQSEMKISEFADGIYFLQVKVGEKVFSKKILKE